MTLAELLASLGNSTTYPFFSGWRAPDPRNKNANDPNVPPQHRPQTITLADQSTVVVDPIAGATYGGDMQCRAYYKEVFDTRLNIRSVDIYVKGYGTENESAMIVGPAKPKPQRLLTLAGVSSAIGDPGPAVEIFLALKAAAEASATNQTVANVTASMFLPLLMPGSGAGLDFADPATAAGVDRLVFNEILTETQGNLLKGLATQPITSF